MEQTPADEDFRVSELMRGNHELIRKALLGRAEWLSGARKAAQRELDNPPSRYDREPDEEDHLRERMALFGEEQRRAENLAAELKKIYGDEGAR